MPDQSITRSVSGENSHSGLRMATFLLCPHMTEWEREVEKDALRCLFLKGH